MHWRHIHYDDVVSPHTIEVLDPMFQCICALKEIGFNLDSSGDCAPSAGLNVSGRPKVDDYKVVGGLETFIAGTRSIQRNKVGDEFQSRYHEDLPYGLCVESFIVDHVVRLDPKMTRQRSKLSRGHAAESQTPGEAPRGTLVKHDGLRNHTVHLSVVVEVEVAKDLGDAVGGGEEQRGSPPSEQADADEEGEGRVVPGDHKVPQPKYVPDRKGSGEEREEPLRRVELRREALLKQVYR